MACEILVPQPGIELRPPALGAHSLNHWFSRQVVSNSWDPMGCSPQAPLSMARILERVAISFSRGSSPPRDQTRVSCTAGRFFTDWAMREAHWATGEVLKGYHFMGLPSKLHTCIKHS